MRLAYVLVGAVIFVGAVILANFIAFPDAVNAAIELVNSEQTSDGGLRSGFDSVQTTILSGLKGLWNVLFGLMLTGLAYATKVIAWGAQAFDAYLEMKIEKRQAISSGDPADDDWDLLEPVLLKAVEDGDRELTIKIAEKMAGRAFLTLEAAANAKT